MTKVVALCALLLLTSGAFAADKCADHRLAAIQKIKVDKSGLGQYETCTIGITQDAKGNIEALNLKRCPAAIRARVAQDILKSSPLPPSPDPSCIAGESTFSFGNDASN